MLNSQMHVLNVKKKQWPYRKFKYTSAECRFDLHSDKRTIKLDQLCNIVEDELSNNSKLRVGIRR